MMLLIRGFFSYSEEMMCDRGLVENEHEVTILRKIADLGSAKVGIILCCSIVRLHDTLHLSYILLNV